MADPSSYGDSWPPINEEELARQRVKMLQRLLRGRSRVCLYREINESDPPAEYDISGFKIDLRLDLIDRKIIFLTIPELKDGQMPPATRVCIFSLTGHVELVGFIDNNTEETCRISPQGDAEDFNEEVQAVDQLLESMQGPNVQPSVLPDWIRQPDAGKPR